MIPILYAEDPSVFIEKYEYDKLIEIMKNEIKMVIFGYKQIAWL